MKEFVRTRVGRGIDTPFELFCHGEVFFQENDATMLL